MDTKIILLGVVVVAVIALAAVFMLGGGKGANTAPSATSGDENQNVPATPTESDAKTKCTDLCEQALFTMRQEELENGPCLSNEVAPGWVCDIAHSPRQDVDNNASNQCSAFREGRATHFVEVDTNCRFIKAV